MGQPSPLRYYADAAQAAAAPGSAPPPPAFSDLVDLALDAGSVGQQVKIYGLLEEAAAGTETPLAGPYRFLISDSGFNRRGDRVKTKGMDLAAYKKNPVILWAHDQWSSVPVGKSTLSVEGEKIYADAIFDIDDPFAARIAGSVQRGFLKACSVGLRLLALQQRIKEGAHDGWDIEESELLEWSVCPVGANSRALKNSYGPPGESLAAVADALGWKADPLLIMSLSPAEISGIRRDLTGRQLAQELLDRRAPADLSIGFRQLGLAAPWENAEAWGRFAAALGDSADPSTAARCAVAAGLTELAGWLREIPAPSPAPPAAPPVQVQLAAPAAQAPPPVFDTAALAAQVVNGIAPALVALTSAIQGRIHQANLGAAVATGTPLIAN
jgi:HK97 family phage prohead protease